MALCETVFICTHRKGTQFIMKLWLTIHKVAWQLPEFIQFCSSILVNYYTGLCSSKNLCINVTENVLILQCHVKISKETFIQQSWCLEKKKETFTISLLSGACHKLNLHRNKKLRAFEEQPYHSQSQVNSHKVVLVCKISIKAEGQQCGAILYNKWKVIR